MLLCGGDQLLFALYSTSMICLLLGGCLWGQGTESVNSNKMGIGIVIFTAGSFLLAFAILVHICKRIQQIILKRKRKKKSLKISTFTEKDKREIEKKLKNLSKCNFYFNQASNNNNDVDNENSNNNNKKKKLSNISHSNSIISSKTVETNLSTTNSILNEAPIKFSKKQNTDL